MHAGDWIVIGLEVWVSRSPVLARVVQVWDGRVYLAIEEQVGINTDVAVLSAPHQTFIDESTPCQTGTQAQMTALYAALQEVYLTWQAENARLLRLRQANDDQREARRVTVMTRGRWRTMDEEASHA